MKLLMDMQVGTTENPTYQLSNTGRTGHAEAVEVIYDPDNCEFLYPLLMSILGRKT